MCEPFTETRPRLVNLFTPSESPSYVIYEITGCGGVTNRMLLCPVEITLLINTWYSTPFGNDPKPRVRSTDNVVLYSTPVSRQTDKFESPKFPIYSKILRDLRGPHFLFRFQKVKRFFGKNFRRRRRSSSSAVLLSNF